MPMRKILLILTLLSSIVLPVAAQHKKDASTMRKELNEYRIKYLAQEMELKPEQQKRFVEVYAQMTEEKDKAFAEARKLERRVRKCAECSDSDYAKASEAVAAAKIKEGEIEKKYDVRFAEFLTQKQIYKMKEAEVSFREKMREMRHRHKKSKSKSKSKSK